MRTRWCGDSRDNANRYSTPTHFNPTCCHHTSASHLNVDSNPTTYLHTDSNGNAFKVDSDEYTHGDSRV